MYNTILKTAGTLKKMDLYEQEVREKLSWVDKEIENPTPVEGMTLEDKFLKLKEVRVKFEEILTYLKDSRSNLKTSLNKISDAPVFETAEVFNQIVKG